MNLPAFLLLLGVTTISCTSVTTTEEPIRYESCRYWCIYTRPYCCDDASLPLPKDHLTHTHLDCPSEDQQICKTSGIYLNGTSPSMVLLKGDPKKQLLCASDGYCQEDEKCCPSPCIKKHLCMKGLMQKAVQEEKQLQEEKGLLPDLEEEEEGIFSYLADE